MKILIIGSGGREHAIASSLNKSPQVTSIHCAPGNAGIAQIATCVNIPDIDIDSLLSYAIDNAIDLTVVGPEAPLSLGIVDRFQSAGQRIFGPSQAATQVESSKQWAKQLMVKNNIPTAKYQTFSDYNQALAYVNSQGAPIVLKYDGLAAGKGVVVAQTIPEADQALRSMLLDDQFGQGRVLIEECLTGPEFSFLCFANDLEASPMPVSQDHKRAYDNDRGPNTGGMGAYSPVPGITDDHKHFALHSVVLPMLQAMHDSGCPFYGVLYAGLMLTPDGIKVIEFNARFGDPETEVILPLLNSDIYNIFANISEHKPMPEIQWSDKSSVGIVLASQGYPAAYTKGHVINNLDTIQGTLFHMGTTTDNQGNTITNGGRVIIATAQADTLQQARTQAYSDIANIKCDTLFHRTDIALGK